MTTTEIVLNHLNMDRTESGLEGIALALAGIADAMLKTTELAEKAVNNARTS